MVRTELEEVATSRTPTGGRINPTFRFDREGGMGKGRDGVSSKAGISPASSDSSTREGRVEVNEMLCACDPG
jgi:hypothetical protein